MHCVDLGESFPTSYSNEYLLAKIGVDTAENEPLKIWGKIQFLRCYTPQNVKEHHTVTNDPVRVHTRRNCVKAPRVTIRATYGFSENPQERP